MNTEPKPQRATRPLPASTGPRLLPRPTQQVPSAPACLFRCFLLRDPALLGGNLASPEQQPSPALPTSSTSSGPPLCHTRAAGSKAPPDWAGTSPIGDPRTITQDGSKTGALVSLLMSLSASFRVRAAHPLQPPLAILSSFLSVAPDPGRRPRASARASGLSFYSAELACSVAFTATSAGPPTREKACSRARVHRTTRTRSGTTQGVAEAACVQQTTGEMAHNRQHAPPFLPGASPVATSQPAALSRAVRVEPGR